MLSLAACGGTEERERAGAAAPTDEDARLIHVHGLGVDPADRALYIATHTGLFRAAEKEQRARRVGDSNQDTMGFTVVGPRRFLGSGHPDGRSDEPPLLGLIESQDSGRTWQAVALQGEVDFHVLRTAGAFVYGFDASSGRLLRGAGQGWSEVRFPGSAVIDLLTNSQDPDALVVMTDRGLYRSSNAGRRWRRLKADGPGLLLRDTERALILVRVTGEVQRSRDGRRWSTVGRLEGQPAAAVAQGSDLYVALHEGPIMQSTDGGRSWRVRVNR